MAASGKTVFLATFLLASVGCLGCEGLSSRLEQGADRKPTRPSVLFVMIDTLRFDHLRAYGYARETSNTIDRLAERGSLYESHVASSSQTVPSTLTVMLSQHPAEHGFRYESVGHFVRNRPLYPEELVFLPEVLSKEGFATAGYVSNPWLTQENGFAQGFDDFYYSNQRGASLTIAAQHWLEHQWDRQRPFFVYLHYFDVHWRYDPLPPYRERFPAVEGGRVLHSTGPPYTPLTEADLQATIAAYDGEIAYVDDQVASLLSTLDELGMADDTLIVITSDHGDEFLEHGGLGHGTTVYGELIRVPLIMVYPGRFEPGRRVTEVTSHIELAPTILDVLQLEPPESFHGPTLGKSGVAFSEVGAWRSVQDERTKLIVNDETQSREVFAAGDALDATPLGGDEAEADREPLARHLDRYRAIVAPRRDAHPDEWLDQQEEQLRALGYVE